jgi:hypothetical protein
MQAFMRHIAKKPWRRRRKGLVMDIRKHLTTVTYDGCEEHTDAPYNEAEKGKRIVDRNLRLCVKCSNSSGKQRNAGSNAVINILPLLTPQLRRDTAPAYSEADMRDTKRKRARKMSAKAGAHHKGKKSKLQRIHPNLHTSSISL